MSAHDRDPTVKAPYRPSLFDYYVDGDKESHSSTAPQRSEAVTVERIGDFLEVDLRYMGSWLKAGIRLAIVLAAIGAIFAGAYGLLATPRYTVSTEVLIEPANIPVINNDLYTDTPQQGERFALTMANRARLVTSGNVLERVVENLHLGDDPEFYKPPAPSLLSSLTGSTPGPTAAPDPKLAAFKALREGVSISMDGKSFIAEMTVNAQSIGKAIAISNAIVEALNAELAGSEADDARSAAAALDERLAALKSGAVAADQAVETYKQTHRLSTGENGQLISSQTVTQSNAQVLAARTRVIDAQANYNALLRASDGSASSIPNTSDTLRELKLQAGNLEQQLSAQRITYGARHPSIVRTQSALEAVRQQIKGELSRSTASAKSELDKANEALRQLSSNMTSLENSAFSDSQSQVDLRELQREAAAKTQVYESFLSRVRQVTERERITTDKVRIVTPPLPPGGRSWPPRTALLIVIGAFAGFAIGLGIALLRGVLGDIRTPRQRVKI